MTEPATSDQPAIRPIPLPLRQCGRCRLFFPTATDLHPAELKEWWACDGCAAKIVPHHRRTPASPASPAD